MRVLPLPILLLAACAPVTPAPHEEIVRMLSGAKVTPEARAQADRLLEGV